MQGVIAHSGGGLPAWPPVRGGRAAGRGRAAAKGRRGAGTLLLPRIWREDCRQGIGRVEIVCITTTTVSTYASLHICHDSLRGDPKAGQHHLGGLQLGLLRTALPGHRLAGAGVQATVLVLAQYKLVRGKSGVNTIS